MNRVLAGLVAAVMVVLAASCGGEEGLACPAAGADDSETYLVVNVVNVEPSVRARLTSIRLELCQSDRCRAITFPSKASKVENEDRKGISMAGRLRYVIALSALAGQWDPDAATRVDIRGRSETGRIVVRHAESFTFRRIYRGGPECDPNPFLRHTMYIGPEDLVRRPN